MSRHKYAEVIAAWAYGADIEYSCIPGEWHDFVVPTFVPSFKYRLKSKWQAERDAQAAGRQIQTRYPGQEWEDQNACAFDSKGLEYRIKP